MIFLNGKVHPNFSLIRADCRDGSGVGEAFVLSSRNLERITASTRRAPRLFCMGGA